MPSEDHQFPHNHHTPWERLCFDCALVPCQTIAFSSLNKNFAETLAKSQCSPSSPIFPETFQFTKNTQKVHIKAVFKLFAPEFCWKSGFLSLTFDNTGKSSNTISKREFCQSKLSLMIFWKIEKFRQTINWIYFQTSIDQSPKQEEPWTMGKVRYSF